MIKVGGVGEFGVVLIKVREVGAGLIEVEEVVEVLIGVEEVGVEEAGEVLIGVGEVGEDLIEEGEEEEDSIKVERIGFVAVVSTTGRGTGNAISARPRRTQEEIQTQVLWAVTNVLQPSEKPRSRQ